MFSLDQAVDKREQARIEARRRAEQERRERIFDAKTRTKGRDLEALQAQAEEKRQREQEERDRLRLEAEEMNRQEQMLILLERRKQEDLRALRKKEAEYRQQHQQAHMRREYDLNDPHANRYADPIRVGDDDPRLGASSLQKFDGEDLGFEDRKRRQTEQQQAWAVQQMQMQRRRQEEEQYVERLQDLQMRERAQREAELQAAVDEARRDALAGTKQYNRSLAEEQERRRMQQRAQEEQDKLADMMAALNSDLLSENRDVAVTDTGRILTDRFKGFSEEQIAAIREEQLRQAEEAKELRARERVRQEAETQELRLAARSSLLAERQAERARKEALRRTSEENARLAQQQRGRSQLGEAFSPAPEFFDQFNRSSR